MPLNKEDLQEVASFVRKHLSEWLSEQSMGKPPPVYEIELRERMIRVEEELKNQRDLMKQGFDLIEKRIDQIDKRFQESREDMNKRFEQVDKRFEQVDKRFEELREDMNKRFEQIDRRFEALTKRIDRFMVWTFGIAVSATAIIIAVMKM